MSDKSIVLKGEAAQQKLGESLAAIILPGMVIYCRGSLGVGKTTLTRGVLRGLGYQGSVKSPTYTLLESYQLNHLYLHHMDLYRLADAEELEYLGIRDLAASDAVILAEWPERGEGVLPAADIDIELTYKGKAREIRLIGMSDLGKKQLVMLNI